jgi:hypothetical protein
VADIPRGEVALPSLEEKKRKMRGPLANAEDLVQERFGELIPETISAIQRGVESLLLEANALPVTFAEGAEIRARRANLAFGLQCPACAARNGFSTEQYINRRNLHEVSRRGDI